MKTKEEVEKNLMEALAPYGYIVMIGINVIHLIDGDKKENLPAWEIFLKNQKSPKKGSVKFMCNIGRDVKLDDFIVDNTKTQTRENIYYLWSSEKENIDYLKKTINSIQLEQKLQSELTNKTETGKKNKI